jgi:hypothetical protein
MNVEMKQNIMSWERVWSILKIKRATGCLPKENEWLVAREMGEEGWGSNYHDEQADLGFQGLNTLATDLSCY